MRSLSALKNVIMSLLYEVMLILFGLVVPRLIIGTYGSEVNGLTSTVTHILSILNLLQAGAVGASIFQMFKPVAEKDYYQVSKVIEASKRYFRKIGTIFLVLVIAITPFVSFGVKSELALWEKAFAFIILGLNGAFYFFFTSWFDILFSSHQKRFVMSVTGIAERLLYYALIFIIIFTRLHFVWMYVATLIGTIVKILILYAIYRKEFKPLLVPVEPDPAFKIENKGYLLCNQIATQAVDAMPSVLITSVAGLSCASVYAVYNLVQNMIKMVVRTMQLSVSEVFGNLVVSEGEEKIRRVYNLLEFAFFFFAAILCSCAGFLFMPFIFLYTNGNSLDVNYIYPILAIVIVAYDIFYCMYMPCYTLTNVHGLFKETYLQAVICAVLSVAAAFGLGLIYWPLIMVGPVLYYVSSLIYRTYIAKKKVAWLRLGTFFRRMAIVLTMVALSIALSFVLYANSYTGSWFQWVVHAVACGICALALLGIYMLLFERKEAKALWSYGRNLIFKKIKKK